MKGLFLTNSHTVLLCSIDIFHYVQVLGVPDYAQIGSGVNLPGARSGCPESWRSGFLSLDKNWEKWI